MEQLVLKEPEFPIVSSVELKNSVLHQLVSTNQESPSFSEKVVAEAEAESSTLSPAKKAASATNATMREENVGTDLKHRILSETDPTHDARSSLYPATAEKTPRTSHWKKRWTISVTHFRFST